MSHSLTSHYPAPKSEVSVSPKSCYAVIYNNLANRNEKRIFASAISALKYDICSWRREESLARYWLDDSPAPTASELRTSGGREAVLKAIGSGVLEGDCGCWTGAFWAGLRDSCTIRLKVGERGPWSWRAHFRQAPELERDLREATEVKIEVSRKKDIRGRATVRSISSLFPEPKEPCPEWFAGVLSGMALVKRLGVWVLEAKEVTSRCIGWLGDSGVWHSGAIGGGIWISPFYLPLMAKWSPRCSGSRWEAIKGLKGEEILGGEWLPLSTWEVVFGLDGTGHWPDKAWGLPWAIGHATRARMGVDRKMAHLMAIERGCGSPAGWLKKVCIEWRKEHGKAASNGSQESGT